VTVTDNGEYIDTPTHLGGLAGRESVRVPCLVAAQPLYNISLAALAFSFCLALPCLALSLAVLVPKARPHYESSFSVLHSDLLSSFQVASSSFSPVHEWHEVTLSIHAVFGLPPILLQGEVPWIMPCHFYSLIKRNVYKYVSFYKTVKMAIYGRLHCEAVNTMLLVSAMT